MMAPKSLSFRELDDTELVERFVAQVEGLTIRQVEAEVNGVTANDVSRWRGGRFEWLSEPKRQALIHYLERAGNKPPAEEVALAEEIAPLVSELARVQKGMEAILRRRHPKLTRSERFGEGPTRAELEARRDAERRPDGGTTGPGHKRTRGGGSPGK